MLENTIEETTGQLALQFPHLFPPIVWAETNMTPFGKSGSTATTPFKHKTQNRACLWISAAENHVSL